MQKHEGACLTIFSFSFCSFLEERRLEVTLESCKRSALDSYSVLPAFIVLAFYYCSDPAVRSRLNYYPVADIEFCSADKSPLCVSAIYHCKFIHIQFIVCHHVHHCFVLLPGAAGPVPFDDYVIPFHKSQKCHTHGFL